MDTQIKLQDRTVYLANGTSRYGRAIALRMAEFGANIALADSNAKLAERLAEEIMNLREISDKRGRAGYVPTDFLNASSVSDSVSKAAEIFGGIDIFIDAHLSEKTIDFEKDFSMEALDQLLQVNLKSTILLSHKMCHYFKVRKRGRMIFLLQDLHRLGFEGEALSGVARWGLVSFTKSLAREFVGQNVTVNCVAVGPSEEYLLQRYPDQKSLQLAQDELLKNLKSFRMIDSQEVANTVCFLASPWASGLTGQILSASHGLSMQG